MTFVRVWGQHFRSIKKEQTFWLSDKDGLFLITGKNLIAPQLAGNATGKSTIPDLLCWVLYGRTARNLSASDIANWDQEGMTCGAVEVELRGRYYTIRRTWSPNSLTIERKGRAPKTVTQDQLDRLIGLNHSAFLAVVLMGQFNRFFFDLKPAEKLQMFSDVLQLQRWEQLSELAKTLSASCSAKIPRIEQRLAEGSGKLSVLLKQKVSILKNERSYKAHRSRKLNKLSGQIRELHRQIRREQLRQKEKTAALDQLVAKKGRLDRIVSEDRRQHDQLDREYHKRNKDVIIAEQKAKELGGQPTKCPTCGQRLRPSFIKLWKEKKKRATMLATLASNALIPLNNERYKLSALINQNEKSIKDIDKEFNRIRSGVSDKLPQWMADVQVLTVEHRDLMERGNPATEQLHAIKLQIRTLTAYQMRGRRTMAIFKHNRRMADAAAVEFRNVRLWLITEALLQLEVETANALRQLGLPRWKVIFDIERVTQSGNVSRGFNVLIESPTSNAPVKWECWSGGETGRLRIAGACGLAELIRSRVGIRPNVEIWDEPTSWLSGKGIDDLLAFFESRAHEDSRQVWLIDHRVLSSGNFSGEIIVSLTEEGSVIKGERYHYGSVV